MAAPCHRPVSYTHLDVYKRQMIFTFEHLLGALILGLAGAILRKKITKDKKKSYIIGAIVCVLAIIIKLMTLYL